MTAQPDARVRPTGRESGRAQSKIAGGDTRLTARVRGRARVALAATDVDELGFVADTGVHRVWTAVVDTAVGSELEVDLGATRHVAGRVVEMLADAVRGGAYVTVVAQPSAYRRYVASIRAALEQVIV